ncbi:MAG: hypothetical protein JXR87_03790 [Candidatus Marinimicrobia bacterium]|nr:hypothetical protein [Candidatus Neomarinimicrobiota bacterium]
MGRIGAKFLLLTIGFSGILFGQAKVLHSPPRNIRANSPITIEALIEGAIVETQRVRLFYRVGGQDSFVEEDMNEYMGVYTGTIPADYVTPEGVEYLVIAEMADGKMIAFPEVDPYNIPMLLTVRKATEITERAIPVNSPDIQGGIRSDIIILSPEEGEIIAAEEVVLAFSLFNMIDVDINSIDLTLDGISVIKNAEITEDVIMYRPKNIKPGVHTVKLNMFNQFGDPYATEIINFTVVKTVEEAKRVLKYTGRVAAEANSEQVRGVRQNINSIRANASGSYDWLSFKAKAFITSQEDPTKQPRNRLTLGLSTSVFDLSVGDVTPQFSELSLQGKRVRGVEANLKLKYFNTHIIYGQTDRAIEGAIGISDTLEGGVIQYSRSGYTYDRNLLAVRPYFGSGKNFQLGFSLLKSRDDTLSVKKEFGGITETSEQSIVMGGVNKPKDNIVVGTDLMLAFDQKRFVWKTDAAFSYLNRDINGGALTLEEMDTFLPGDSLQNDTITLGDMNIPLAGFPDPGDFTKIFIINQNLSPLMPIVPDSSGAIGMKEFLNMPSTAFKTVLKLNYFNNFFVVRYQRVGPEFTSLGNPYMRTDVQGYNISDKIRLFGNKLFVTLAYDQKRDNLLKNKNSTTTTSSFSASVALYPGEGLPNINFNTQSYGRQNDLDINDITYDTTYTETGDPLYSFKDPRESNVTTRQDFRITHIVKVGDIKNTLNISYANSERNDRIDDRLYGYQFNKTSASSFSFGVNSAFAFPLKTNFKISSNTSESESQADPYKMFTVLLRGRYEFFDGKLAAEAGYTLTNGSGLVDFSKHDMFTGGMYQLGEDHQFHWRLRYVNINDRMTNEVFNDPSFMVNYTFLF